PAVRRIGHAHAIRSSIVVAVDALVFAFRVAVFQFGGDTGRPLVVPGGLGGPVIDGAGTVVAFIEGAARVEVEHRVGARLPGHAHFPPGAGAVFPGVAVEVLALGTEPHVAGGFRRGVPDGTAEHGHVGAVAPRRGLLVVVIGVPQLQQRTNPATQAV